MHFVDDCYCDDINYASLIGYNDRRNDDYDFLAIIVIIILIMIKPGSDFIPRQLLWRIWVS